MFRLGAPDINDGDLNGLFEDATFTGTVVGDSFSFTVTPKPAAISLLLAGAALLVRRRQA